MGKPMSLDDTSIPEKLSLLSDEEAVVNPSIKPWSHRHPQAALRMVCVMVVLMIYWPLAFIYPGFHFHSQSPIAATGRCTKL